MRSRSMPGRPQSMFGDRERGFTLIEALVSLAILGLAILAMLQASAGALQTQTQVEHHLAAVALAESRLQELTLLPADSLLQYASPRSGTVSLASRRYEWLAVVQRDSTAPALWRAAVSVGWADGGYELETIFYRRGRGVALR